MKKINWTQGEYTAIFHEALKRKDQVFKNSREWLDVVMTAAIPNKERHRTNDSSGVLASSIRRKFQRAEPYLHLAPVPAPPPATRVMPTPVSIQPVEPAEPEPPEAPILAAKHFSNLGEMTEKVQAWGKNFEELVLSLTATVESLQADKDALQGRILELEAEIKKTPVYQTSQLDLAAVAKLVSESNSSLYTSLVEYFETGGKVDGKATNNVETQLKSVLSSTSTVKPHNPEPTAAPSPKKFKIAVLTRNALHTWGLEEKFPDVEFSFHNKGRNVMGTYHKILMIHGHDGLSHGDKHSIEARYGKKLIAVTDYSREKTAAYLRELMVELRSQVH